MHKSEVIILLVFPILCACSPIRSSNSTPDIASSIDVTYITGPEVDITDPFTFWIRNTSQKCIVFPIDFGIKLFMEQSGNWTEVNNFETYIAQPGQDAIFLEPAGELFAEYIVDAKPDLSTINLPTPTRFRVTIAGHLCTDENAVIEKSVPFVVRP